MEFLLSINLITLYFKSNENLFRDCLVDILIFNNFFAKNNVFLSLIEE
jgi:hypothetical protein